MSNVDSFGPNITHVKVQRTKHVDIYGSLCEKAPDNNPMPRDKKDQKPKPEPILVATAQQSRFHSGATDPAEVGSKDVTMSPCLISCPGSDCLQLDICGLHLTIGNREILTDAEVKLQYGTHYAVIGRNGIGKSSER
jgi:ABC-type multidrug transport system fused ATPase/permease subunit